MQQLIEEAACILKGQIRNTPIEFSPTLSTLVGQPVYLKLECMQLTGSFKVRGGLFYLSTLSQAERANGVAACSAGNHGLGVAFAARQLQVPCTVFVPKQVDQAKYDQLVELGASVIKSDFIGYDDTLVWAVNQAKSLNVPLVPAYDDSRIMAANGGTLAAEVMEQVPDAGHFVLPMGGGGLAGGFLWYLKQRKPQAKTTICQLADCPALQLSCEQGRAMTYMPPVKTLAGGLEGGLGAQCFDLLKTRVDEIAHVSENELKEALAWLLKHHQYLIEPSAAVALASCLNGRVKPKGPTVLILTGRNVDEAKVRNILTAR